LEDYNPEELAEICEHAAADRFKLSFAPGLRGALATHIRIQHGLEIKQHNGGLAVTLAERAFRKLATRLGDPSGAEAISGQSSRELLPEDFEISDVNDARTMQQGQPSSSAAPTKNARREASLQEQRANPPKRVRQAALRDAVRGLAVELIHSLEEAATMMGTAGEEDDDLQLNDGDDSAPCGPPTREDRGRAVAKVLAKAKEKERERETVREEEALPQQEGERVIEEVSTQDALDHLGLCPANFEWFEVNVASPPDENCGICNYKLSDGYRCGGGTHFVCMGCIDAYKTRGRD